MKPAGLRPSRNRRPGEPSRLELQRAEYSALALGQAHKDFCVDFVSLSETNLTQFGHAPMFSGRMCRECDSGAHSLPVLGLFARRVPEPGLDSEA